jgi:prepilin-type N-terminal cleavage/methylation domain-containing protein
VDNLHNRVMRRRRRGQGGFTLIELLVVIAILSVLAAIVIINVTGVKGNAQNSACQSDTEAVQTAVDGYYVQAALYPDGTGTGAASADTASPSPGDPVDIPELLNATQPYLQASPQAGEYFFYSNSTGSVQGQLSAAYSASGFCLKG